MPRQWLTRIFFFSFFPWMILFVQFAYGEVPDPTRPTGYVGEEGNNPWQLNAIIISPLRRIAIIGGLSVKVGDEISGEKIIAIEANSVTLEGTHGKTVLYLNKNIKQLSD